MSSKKIGVPLASSDSKDTWGLEHLFSAHNVSDLQPGMVMIVNILQFEFIVYQEYCTGQVKSFAPIVSVEHISSSGDRPRQNTRLYIISPLGDIDGITFMPGDKVYAY